MNHGLRSLTISDLPDGIHILVLHFNLTMRHKGFKWGIKMWTALLGWPGLGLARLGWLPSLA